MVGVNRMRSKPFTLSQSSQGYPMSPQLYLLALELFLHKLRVISVLGRIMVPSVTTTTRYYNYAVKITMLVTSRAEIEEGSKKKSEDMKQCQRQKLTMEIMGKLVEGLYPKQPLQLYEWTQKDTLHLVWPQPPTKELIRCTGKGISQGKCQGMSHNYPLNISSPMYYSS